MKLWLLTLVLVAATVANAAPFPEPSPTTPPRNAELMKCWSADNGTIWASFGHVTSSDHPEVKFFPTEIVLFSNSMNARLLYPTLEEALKVDVEVSHGRIHLEFTAQSGGVVQKHLIQAINYDSHYGNSYVGNWTVSETGKPDVMGSVGCTAD